MKKEFIVYMATNTVNGKRYIGATRVGLLIRRQRHFKDAKRKGRDCPAFYGAIRKYGQDAFEWEVLATLSTSKKMYKEEERLIAALKPEYNIASGGLVFTSKEKQKEFSEMAARRCSKPVICLNDGVVYPSCIAAEEALGLGRKVVSQTCKRGGITRSGLAFAFLSGPMADEERAGVLSEFRAKKAKAEKARVEKVRERNSRAVICLNSGTIYLNAGAADRAIGLARGTVEYLCRVGRANRDGHCFAFGELTEPDRLRLFDAATSQRRAVDDGWKVKISKRRSKTVVCKNTGEAYRTLQSAADACGLSVWMIWDSCRNNRATKTGMLFSYAGVA